MAVGYRILTHGLFEANDNKLYIGVSSFSLNGDGHTISLTAVASGANFTTGATIDLEKVEDVSIFHSEMYQYDDNSGNRTPGT